MLAALALILTSVLPQSMASSGQDSASSIAGDWREPAGSVIRIAPCGAELCAQLIHISADAPTSVDAHNPDPSLRTRPLCGLQIGRGFHLEDAQHAEGGSLYDPKTGKTYSGSMTLDKDRLQLRGYVGIKLFGRTETWQRTSQEADACATAK